MTLKMQGDRWLQTAIKISQIRNNNQQMTTALIKNIDIPLTQIRNFCQKWQIVEFALFGSVLREDFRL